MLSALLLVSTGIPVRLDRLDEVGQDKMNTACEASSQLYSVATCGKVDLAWRLEEKSQMECASRYFIPG